MVSTSISNILTQSILGCGNKVNYTEHNGLIPLDLWGNMNLQLSSCDLQCEREYQRLLLVGGILCGSVLESVKNPYSHLCNLILILLCFFLSCLYHQKTHRIEISSAEWKRPLSPWRVGLLGVTAAAVFHSSHFWTQPKMFHMVEVLQAFCKY